MPGMDKISELEAARRVLVRRKAALGDVIMSTPVMARLRYLLGPDTIVDVETAYPHVFIGNPHVNSARVSMEESYDLVIALDNAYEKRRDLHTIDAYMVEAFGDTRWPSKELFIAKHRLPESIKLDWTRCVVLHPGQTSRARTVTRGVWEGIINRLIGCNLIPVVVGATREISVADIDGVADLTGRLSLQQLATLIQYSRCFVSADTGMSHVAATTDTPIVTVYTSVFPQHRISWRHGVFSWRVTPLTPKLPCVGCIHECTRADYACIEGEHAVRADQIFDAIISAMEVQ